MIPTIYQLNDARNAWVIAQRNLRNGNYTDYDAAVEEEARLFDIFYNIHIDYHKPR